MAVNSVKLIKITGGQSVSQTGFSETWTGIFRVCTDSDCVVNPACLILEAQTDFNLPALGGFFPPVDFPAASQCKLNNDAVIFVNSVQAGESKKVGKACCIDVTIVWSTETPPGGGGTDPTDPITNCPTVEQYEQSEFEAVENGVFLGIWQESATAKPLCAPCATDNVDLLDIVDCAGSVIKEKDTCGPIETAACQPFNPPLERDRTLDGFRISFNSSTYNPDLYRCYRSTINCVQYEISIPCRNFLLTVAPGTALVKSITGRHAEFNSGGTIISYWVITFDILIDPRGWCRDYLNKGTQRSKRIECPDGHGGNYTSQDIIDGEANVIPVTADGFALTEPVLLDNTGQPLSPGDDRWWLRYCEHSCTNHVEFMI